MLSVIWRSKWIIIAAALVASGFVAYDSFTSDTVYQAESVLIVNSLTPTNTFSNEDKLAASYAELAMTEAVQARARELVDIPGNSSGITADTKTDSPFIRISASNKAAERAVNDANAVSEALVTYIDVLQKDGLESKRELLIEQLSDIDSQRQLLASAVPVDQARIEALDSVRESIIRQNAELNAGLVQSSLVIVDGADTASEVPSHPLRNTIISFVLGAIAGTIIGFAVDAVRKALRWQG